MAETMNQTYQFESFVIARGIKHIVDGHRVVSDHTANGFKAANWLSSKTGKQVKIFTTGLISR